MLNERGVITSLVLLATSLQTQVSAGLAASAALWATSCVGCEGPCSLLSVGCPPGLQLIFSEKCVDFYPFGPQPALVHGLLLSQLQEYLGFGIDPCKLYLLL